MESVNMPEGKEDVDCPHGGLYYSCPPIFVGCCLVDACDGPDGSCSSNPPGDSSPAPKTKTASPSPPSSLKATSDDGAPVKASSSPFPTPTPLDTTTSDAPRLSPTTTPPDLPSAISVTTPVSTSTTSITSDAGSDTPKSSLGDTAIAGISIGGTIGGLFVLFVLFLLIRRRKLSKRMPSFVDRRGGDKFQEKLVEDNNHSPLSRRPAQDDDVFAPFGGRASSPIKATAQTDQGASQRKGAASRQSLRSTGGSSYVVSPVSPDFTGSGISKHLSGNGHAGLDETASGVPVQLDSRPLYFELDSADTERASPSELPTLQSGSDQVRHPGQLTPGFPGAALKREANGSPGQAGINVGASAVRESARWQRPVSDGPLRGTLNASPADREANHHVGSWDRL